MRAKVILSNGSVYYIDRAGIVRNENIFFHIDKKKFPSVLSLVSDEEKCTNKFSEEKK